MRRALALALLAAAAACALAAPRAAGAAQPTPDDEAAQHHHHHGMMPWMRRPFSFDATFEGDGSCEVHRSGDGRGTLLGSEGCEKHVHGRVELQRDGGGQVSPRSRDALGAALQARMGADGEVPPGMVEAAVSGALADVAPEELAAALQAGGSLDIKAKAKFSLECSIRKQEEASDEGRGGSGDDGGGGGGDDGSFKAEVRCTMSTEKSGSAQCSRRDEGDGPGLDMIAQLRQPYAWRLARGG